MFCFHIGTNIRFGQGMASEAGKVMKSIVSPSHVLLVVDGHLHKSGLLQQFIETLAREQVALSVFDSFSPEPTDTEVEAGATYAVSEEVTAVLAVGGGSAIDASKAISLLATNAGKIKDYEGSTEPQSCPLPLVAVPTTAGSGSEVTPMSVIRLACNGEKIGIVSDRIAPRVAICDPLLTRTLPPGLTMTTGIDALTHAIESYIGQRANPFTDAYALAAVEMIEASLHRTMLDGFEDIEARHQMLQASVMAGIAFANSDCGPVHSMAFALGSIAGVPHGVSNTASLPLVLRYFEDQILAGEGRLAQSAFPKKLKRLKQALGAGSDEHESLSELVDRLIDQSWAVDLLEYGANTAMINDLAQAAVGFPSTNNSPVLLGVDDFGRLFRQVLT
jgi:alcohol dehydrogenase